MIQIKSTSSNEKKFICKKIDGELDCIPFTLYLSDHDKENETYIICIHGKGASRSHWREFAEYSASKGYGIFTYDRRGFGENGEEWDFKEEIKDVQKIARFLKKEMNAKELVVLGHSQGGAVAIIATAENKEINKIVLWGSASDLSLVNKTAMKEIWWYRYVHSYFRFDFEEVIPLYEYIGEISPRPVLLIYSKFDPMRSNAEKLYNAAEVPKELWWYRGLHWPYLSSTRERVYTKILKFVESDNYV